jgi:hypothetical protein
MDVNSYGGKASSPGVIVRFSLLASSFILLSFWDAKKKKNSLQVDMVAVITRLARNGCWRGAHRK